MIIFKIIIHILVVIGLILLFCIQIGCLSNKNKAEFFKEIQINLEANPDTKGATLFLNKYFFVLPMTEKEKEMPIDKIVYVGTFVKHGESRKEIVSGVIKVRNIQGDTSPALCSMNELENWTKTTPFWDWFALSLVTVTVLIEIGITLFSKHNS